MRLEFRALGPLEVVDGGREVAVDGRVRRRLLAALLLEPAHPVSVEALERAAWGDDPPQTARRVVQSHLSRLRSLGLAVRRTEAGYVLDVHADVVDAHRFRDLAEGPRLADASADELQEALRWWRGDAWHELSEVFPVAEQRELVECRAAIRERIALLELIGGLHRAAAANAEAAIRDDPRRETAWILRAVALHCEQRRADALRVLHEARRSVGAAGLDAAPVLREVEGWLIAETPEDEVVGRLARRLGATQPGASDVRSAPPPGLVDASALPFSGRRGELAALGATWELVAAAGFRTVLLSGEPGVGKSRIAAEVALSVQRRGAVVIHGTCDAELEAPFQPVLEALRSAAASMSGDHLRVLSPLAPELRRFCPELFDGVPGAATDDTDPETARFRAISALVESLRRLSAASGLVVVLDDLQWCDAGTAQVLRRMAREQPARVLVIGTYRDTELRPRSAWSETLPELLRYPVVDRWSVDGLDVQSVTDLINRLAPPAGATTQIAEDLAEILVETTGGNALFIVQLLQHLLETGGMACSGTRRLAGDPLVDLPSGVRDLVERRIAAAHDLGIEVLERAAVVGHRFDRTRLCSLLPGDTPVDEVVEALLRARLVSELGAGRFRFAHALIRAAVLERMSGTRRARLHLDVVQRLDGDAATTAVHWEEAAALDAELLHHAIDSHSRAGDLAMELRSPDSAIRHYRRAVELCDIVSTPLAPRIDLETRLGTAERQIGETGHRRRLLAAGRQALAAGMPAAAAQAALATYNGIPSRYLDANGAMLGLLDDVLERADELPFGVAAAVSALRATEVLFSANGERRSAASRDALTVTDGCGDDAVEGRALSAALLMYFTEELSDRQDLAARLDRLRPRLPPRDRVVADVSLIQFQVSRGNMDDVPTWLADARTIASALGEPELRCYLGMAEVQVALLGQGVAAARGALEDMSRLATQSNAWMARMPEPFGWTVDVFEGRDFDRLADAYEAGLAARPKLPLLRASAAYTAVRCGRHGSAQEHLDALAAIDFDAADRTWGYAAMLVLSALTAAELRSTHREQLRDLLARSRTVVPLQPMPHDTPTHAMGVLDASLGELDSALEQFDLALVVYERIGARLFAARTEAAAALTLADRRRPGDADRARSLARRARTAARQLHLGDIPDLSAVV